MHFYKFKDTVSFNSCGGDCEYRVLMYVQCTFTYGTCTLNRHSLNTVGNVYIFQSNSPECI